MAVQGELRVFLRRTAEGAYRLVSEDGALVVQGSTYRDVRTDLARLIRDSALPSRVKILIGAPQESAVPLNGAPYPRSEIHS
jgi:hypothetical protein